MTRIHLPHLAALLALTLLLAPTSARAASPDPAERAAARRLMDEGDRKAEVKDYRGALDAYQKADAIVAVPSTGIDVAKMHLALGHLVEAWQVAASVTRFPLKPAEPEGFARARADAEAMVAEILPRIPTLQIKVNGVTTTAPIEVTIDGAKVTEAELRTPRKLNPGKHVVTASARGFTTASSSADLPEGKASTLLLTLAPSKDPGASSGRSPLVYVGFGLGAAGLVAGTITGILSLTAVGAAKDVCSADGRCPPSAQPDLDRALTMANISNVSLGVGLAGVGLGIVGLAISPRSGQSAQRATPFRAALVPLSSGAAIRGWF